MGLQGLLAYLEEHIKPDEIKKSEERHISAMNFSPVDYLPITIAYPTDPRIKPFPYSLAAQDMEKMLYNELAGIDVNTLNSIMLGDDYPLQIRPNYGIGVIASLFDLPSVIKMDNMPWVTHLEGTEQLKAILDRGIPEPDTGLGQKVRQTLEYYRETLKPYPKCAKMIHVTQPDLQGPFDILHLMLGSELFYALYDEPELIHDALSLISETYIRYHRFITPYTNALIDGDTKCVVHQAIYGGTLVIKDDTATATLSEQMYAEFVAPYNTRILKALIDTGKPRTGSIHFCGTRKEWHYPQMLAQPLDCLNFGNPELHDFPSHYRELVEAGVCTVGFGQNNGYEIVHSLIEAGVHTGVTLLIEAKSFEEARQILRGHQNKGDQS